MRAFLSIPASQPKRVLHLSAAHTLHDCLRLCCGLAAFLLVWLGSAPLARGHYCGQQAYEISPGVYLYFITADVLESQPSIYEVINRGDTNVVTIENPDVFAAFAFGSFRLRTGNPGTTQIQLRWSYPPNSATGLCTVSINVTNNPVKTAANFPFSQYTLDPVNVFNGELTQSEQPDFFLGGPMPLVFRRHYASMLVREPSLLQPFGPNWSHNFNWQLVRSGNDAAVITAEGRRIAFTKSGAAWQTAAGEPEPFQLVEFGGNLVLGDPREARLYTFNTNAQLVAVSDGRGNTHTLTYTGFTLTQVSDGLGRTLGFTYIGPQEIRSVTDGTRTVNYGYDFLEQLTSVTNALGRRTTYAYTTSAAGGTLLTSMTLPRGNTLFTQSYDTSGRVASQGATGFGTSRFRYGNGFTSVTNPLNQVRTYFHSATGQLTSVTDAANQVVSLNYNAAGQPASVTDRLGARTAQALHAPSGKPASVSHPDGSTTSFSYTPRTNATGIVFYDLTSVNYPDGTTESFLYDANGNLTRWSDRAARNTFYGSNNRGQITAVTNALGFALLFAYNPDGTLASASTLFGNVTTFGYDGLRRRTSLTRPDGTTVLSTFDALDRTTSTRDELGYTNRFLYNLNGYLDTIVDPLGGTNRLTYDSLDRLTGLIDAEGHTMAGAWNSLGRLGSLTNRNGGVWKLSYDSRGRLQTVTDPGNNVITFAHDDEGRATSITDALNHTTSFTSDSRGRAAMVTTPEGNAFALTYDTFGAVRSYLSPEGDTSTWSYDPSGLLTGAMNGGAAAASYTRSALGPTEAIVDGRNQAWRYPRNVAAGIAQEGDPLIRDTTYFYDLRGRVNGLVFPGGLGTLTNTYDGRNQLTRQLFSAGPDLQFKYDPLGFLTNANGVSFAYNRAGQLTNCNGLAIGRDAGGRLISVTVAPGKTITYNYDNRDLVTQISDWNGGVTTFNYDAAGRLVSIVRPNGVNTTNRFNAESLITNLQHGALASLALVRNGNGQVVQATRTLPLTPTISALSNTFSFDAASQLAGPTYDALGRLTADSTRICSWDGGGRLTSHAPNPPVAGPTTFTYDAFGQRLSRTFTTTANYVWNYAFTLPSISVERLGVTDQRYYVHLPNGLLLYSIDAASNARRFYHYDEAGNTLFLTDGAGAIAASYAYGPYGEPLGSSGATDNPFTWQGSFGVMNEGNGLYYLRARYYDSRTARFLSRDPIHSLDPRRVNPYQYAAGDPLSLGDPTGLDASSGYVQWRGGALLDTAFLTPGKFNGYAWGGGSMSGFTYRESAGLLDGIGAAKTFQSGMDHPLIKTGLGYPATLNEQFMPPITAKANVFDPSAFRYVNYGAPTVKAEWSLRYDAAPDYSGFRINTGAFDQEGSYRGILTPKTYPVNIPGHLEKSLCCFETDGMLGCLEESTDACRFGPPPPHDFYRPDERRPVSGYTRSTYLGTRASY